MPTQLKVEGVLFVYHGLVTCFLHQKKEADHGRHQFERLAAGNYECVALRHATLQSLTANCNGSKGPRSRFIADLITRLVTHGVPPTYLTPRKRVAGL